MIASAISLSIFFVASEDALRALRGETIKVVVSAVYPDNLKVIASQVNAERKIRRAEKEAALNALAGADVVTGTVEKVLEFGAIVNLGAVSGLLHQNEMDHKRVRVSDVVKVGDTVTVKVLEVNGEKISLSMKALKAHPWDVLKEQYHEGSSICPHKTQQQACCGQEPQLRHIRVQSDVQQFLYLNRTCETLRQRKGSRRECKPQG